jgi:hypothetical protein
MWAPGKVIVKLQQKLSKATTDTGATVYDLSILREQIGLYEAARVAAADLLDLPTEKVPMDAGEQGEAFAELLSEDTPDRFDNPFIGMEYMGKYRITIHRDGTMVVKDLPVDECS